MDNYATAEISDSLVTEIKQAISGKEFGSVEIYIESGRVVQITERVIRKTLRSNGNEKSENNKKEILYWKPIRNRK